MTQEQWAQKTGTKKSFISRIENGHSDIRLSTLYKVANSPKVGNLIKAIDST